MSVWLRLNCQHDYEALRMNERTARPQVVPRALGAGICFYSTDSSLCLWFYSNPQFSSVQSLSCVRLFETPWTAACQASLSITNSQSLLKLMLIELVMPFNHLIPFSSRLQSFPASGSFQRGQIFASGGQSIGVSASTSVLPMNTQD